MKSFLHFATLWCKLTSQSQAAKTATTKLVLMDSLLHLTICFCSLASNFKKQVKDVGFKMFSQVVKYFITLCLFIRKELFSAP